MVRSGLLVWSGSVKFSQVRSGSVRFGQVQWFGQVRCKFDGSVSFGQAWSGSLGRLGSLVQSGTMVRSGLLVQSGSARFTTFQDVKLYIMKLVSTFRFLHFLNFRAKIKDFFEHMTIDNLKIVADDFYF